MYSCHKVEVRERGQSRGLRSPTGRRVSLWHLKLTRLYLSISKLSHQIARGTNKYQVGSEIVVVHALVKATARFSKSFVARI